MPACGAKPYENHLPRFLAPHQRELLQQMTLDVFQHASPKLFSKSSYSNGVSVSE